MLKDLRARIAELHKKHEARLDVLFFIGGFIFDAFMVSEVDDLFSLAQQALYLFVIAFFLHHEVLFRTHKWRPSGNLVEKVWNWRNLILHFLLGTLLNIYSLFYIKSASILSSLFFLLVMVALLVANESKIVKRAKVSLKVGLFAICLFSYISILFPLILGFVGWTPFGLSVATTMAVFYFQFKMLKSKLPDEGTLFRVVLLPGLSVLIVFSLFYVAGWIPPVPLSVKEQGIYHLVEKKDGEYLLSTEKVWWKFWLSGDQDFKAQPGDKIYFYAQIFSPARFADQVFVQWFWNAPGKGWQLGDRIPMNIVGGRKEGFRGYAIKAKYQPGQWRVQVETSMGQEISRLDFEVIPVATDASRGFTVIHR